MIGSLLRFTKIEHTAFNRIFDSRLDALNPRTCNREMPAGRMSTAAAAAVAAFGLVLYLASCGLLNRWCLILSPIPLIPLLGYSLLKRFTVLCHCGIGLPSSSTPVGNRATPSRWPSIPMSPRPWIGVGSPVVLPDRKRDNCCCRFRFPIEGMLLLDVWTWSLVKDG